jgi:hypothetical protein
MQATARMSRPLRIESSKRRRASEERTRGEVGLMGFKAQSATGVPPLQRPNLGLLGARTWVDRRARRGFLTTGLLALLALERPRSASAQSTARFADSPAVTPPSSAAPPASTPPPSAASQPVQQSEPAPADEGWARRLARSHFERGAELERRGDIAQALREYSETINIDPTFGDAYARLGALREHMGDAREAELIYSEAARLGDARARANAFLERSHVRRAAGRAADALSDLERAVELDANRSALEELAQTYVENHAWAAALAVFRRIAANAAQTADTAGQSSARLEVRALAVLAAETDPTSERPKAHDWVARALRSIARR